jgi:hypothetical protein
MRDSPRHAASGSASSFAHVNLLKARRVHSDEGPLARDMESAIAWVTGPVDVAVLNHHGNSDGSNAFFLSVLRPRVAVANVWAARQVDPETLARLRSERIYPGPRDIFATNGMWDGRADHINKYSANRLACDISRT